MRCAVGVTEEFKVELGLPQASVLNLLLLSIAPEGLTDEVRQKSTWSVMFAGDIVGAPTLWRRWRRRILEVWVCPGKDMNEGCVEGVEKGEESHNLYWIFSFNMPTFKIVVKIYGHSKKINNNNIAFKVYWCGWFEGFGSI